MNKNTESNRIERLVQLCKLWGAIKYFHPYLAYREDIDWDAALINAIPAVNAAEHSEDYANAIQAMLQVLGDPVTRIIQESQETQPARPGKLHPIYRLQKDGILVVEANQTRDLSDFQTTIRKFEAIKAELPKASGVLFDFRSAGPAQRERYHLSYAFYTSEIASALTTTTIPTPGERSRIHIGFAPQSSTTSGSYSSAFKVMDGRRVYPAPGAKDIPVVFLVNEWSELPLEALALQAAGKAAIVADGGASDAMVVTTQTFPLAGNFQAEIRLSEIIFEDGSGGITPELTIPVQEKSSKKDLAFQAALELVGNFIPAQAKRVALPARAVPVPDKTYPEMTFPDLEYRLLAAFRTWTVINYFYPYKHLMDEDWDGILQKFIPKLEQADSSLKYHLALAEMVTRLNDSHGFLDSPVLYALAGPAWPPIRVQVVENKVVVTTILDGEAGKIGSIRVGDAILEIDGEDIQDRMEHRKKYISASTPQRLKLLAANACLCGPEGSSIALTICDRDNKERVVKLERNYNYKEAYQVFRINWRSGEAYRLLSDDIGYADLDKLEFSMVDEMFEHFKNTKGIIFDMRGYPKGTAWAIAPRLAQKDGIGAALIQCPVVTMPDGLSGSTTNHSMTYSFIQSLPPAAKWRYPGKTVMLVDERTQGQAEHTGLFLRAANHTAFIGSPTSGANGDITNFYVPGEIKIIFNGQSISHPDGRQLQRIGLVPDIYSRPSIAGLQKGIDEVLECAVTYLRQEIRNYEKKGSDI